MKQSIKTFFEKVIRTKQRNSEIYERMNKYSLLLELLLAFVLNFVIEVMSRHSVVKAWKYMCFSPLTYLYNTYIIFITFLIVYLVRRRMFTRILIGFLWFAIGCINGIVLSVRVTPFNIQDLNVVGDALTMIDKYFSGLQGIKWIALIIVVIIGIVFVWKKVGQYKGKMHRIPALIVILIVFLTIGPITKFAIKKNILTNYFGNVAFAYEEYGVPYCFAASMFGMGIEQPNGYSEEMIMAMTEHGAYAETSTTSGDLPNIVVIQLESFFDVAEVEFLKTTKDPLPTFHYLMENYSSGYCKVPAVGAGTANTEFELLTGMSMQYFGPGEYPYKSIARYKPVESAASALQELGYKSHALHNNNGNFYSRSDVFKNMGFDSFTSSEFMNITKFTENGWATDAILTEHILNAMDSTEQQDFVFCISVEGHGDYTKTIENPEIQVTSIEDPDKKNSWEYYVNHLYATDKFIAKLLENLEKRNEPTILVLYGDHLPAIGLEASDLSSRYLFGTNYVIWDNIGLEEQDGTLTTYQLIAETFNRTGIHAGTVFNYHQNRRKTREYLQNLEMLQYDMLYGKRYVYSKVDYEPQANENFTMGILDVVLNGIDVQDKLYILHGENLTGSSKVYVNGNKQKTTFHNDTQIELSGITLKDGDVITVHQVDSAGSSFRSSAEYVYSEGQLKLATE